MSVLTPTELRGLSVLLSPHRERAARVEERLERGGEKIEARPAPVWVVRGADSLTTHTAYMTALRTLCGLAVTRGVRGRGQHVAPRCEACAATLARHRELGLVGGLIADRCAALTKHGASCQRDPLPGLGYCPSHKKLAA